VMRALGAVHAEGILHRDISPDNIYVTNSGQVKLIDFGAARNALGQKSRNLSIILKEGFAPEEQYRSSGTQGPWTDVYATAGTLYFSITGRIPQGALDRQAEDKLQPPSQLGSDIDPRSEAALMRALSIKAHDRFQSMQDFSAALTGTAVEESSPPFVPQPAFSQYDAPSYTYMPPAAEANPPSSVGGNKWLWVAVGLVAFLLVAFLAFKPASTPTPGPSGASGASGASQAANPASGDYKTLMQQAGELDNKHSYQDEVQVLDKAIQADPKRWEAYDLKAQVYLYNFQKFPEAKENFEASLARGGNATFHVLHDRGAGNFTSKSSGWLYVTRNSVEYRASDGSPDKFNARRSEITDVGSSNPSTSRGKGLSFDHHAFHMRINKTLWMFGPQGQFGEEQRSMILGIIGG
jgi:serine/threonine protein kinase